MKINILKGSQFFEMAYKVSWFSYILPQLSLHHIMMNDTKTCPQIFMTHGPDVIILVWCDENLCVMHNILTKCDQVSMFTWKTPGKMWYSISTGNHMSLCLNVHRMVDKYINEVINQEMCIVIYVDLPHLIRDIDSR